MKSSIIKFLQCILIKIKFSYMSKNDSQSNQLSVCVQPFRKLQITLRQISITQNYRLGNVTFMQQRALFARLELFQQLQRRISPQFSMGYHTLYLYFIIVFCYRMSLEQLELFWETFCISLSIVQLKSQRRNIINILFKVLKQQAVKIWKISKIRSKIAPPKQQVSILQ